jgi:predicted ATP-binding protein involved in virulence
MKLKSLHIKGLFSQYSYNIDFKDDIKIITGPNGYGKSTILRIISNLMDLNFYYFFQIPFEEIVYNFYEDFNVKIIKKIDSTNFSDDTDISDESELLINEKIFISFNDGKEILIDQDKLDSDIEELGYRKFKEDIWKESGSENFYFTSELIKKNHSIIESKFQDDKGKLMLLSGINVSFIQDNRLYSTSNADNYHEKNLIQLKKFEIDNCALELQNYLSKIKSDFNKKFQESQNRIITQMGRSLSLKIVSPEYSDRVDNLNNKFIRAFEFGICEKIDIPTFFEKNVSNYLNITLTEYEAVINEFIEDIEKIELFIKIISKSSFPNKRIEVKEGFGFKFISDNGLYISNNALSSGEQHRLITFYNLIFKIRKNMILLIDEPELSNHVIWQLTFLKDLKSVLKGYNIQTIIATHSPQIIDGKWNLTTDLFKIKK